MTQAAEVAREIIDEVYRGVADSRRHDVHAFATKLIESALITAERAGIEKAAQWQPIETAPKDGTDFLALIPFQKVHHQMVGKFAPNGNFVSWPGRWPYDPTHWMPLPQPDALKDQAP